VSLQGQVKKYKAKAILALCCPRCPLYLRDSLPWQVAPSVEVLRMCAGLLSPVGYHPAVARTHGALVSPFAWAFKQLQSAALRLRRQGAYAPALSWPRDF